MSDVSAVVLNWRTAEHTLRARAALVADGVPPERVLVVDNGSGDGSVDRFASEAADSPLLALDENLGFARANNLGAARLPATRAYLFVNGDAFVHAPGSVGALIRALARPEVAVAVPRLRNPDLSLQPSVRPLAGPLPALVQASGCSRLVPNRWQPALSTHWDHARSRRIQAADGPVLAVDAATFVRVGGFAEWTHLYGEDHDLFRQAARCGGQGRFVAEAEFVHIGGASSAQRWTEAGRAERVARAEGAVLMATLVPVSARLTISLLAAGAAGRAWLLARRGRSEPSAVHAAWLAGYRAALSSERPRSERPRP